MTSCASERILFTTTPPSAGMPFMTSSVALRAAPSRPSVPLPDVLTQQPPFAPFVSDARFDSQAGTGITPEQLPPEHVLFCVSHARNWLMLVVKPRRMLRFT